MCQSSHFVDRFTVLEKQNKLFSAKLDNISSNVFAHSEKSCFWMEIQHYLNEKQSVEERDHVFFIIFPRIIKLALSIEKTLPQSGLHFSRHRTGELESCFVQLIKVSDVCNLFIGVYFE